MSKPNTKRSGFNLWYGVFILLIVAVSVQGYFLYMVYQGEAFARVASPVNADVEVVRQSVPMSSGSTNTTGSLPTPPALLNPGHTGPAFGFGLWNPWEEMRRMQQEMDQLIQESFGRLPMMDADSLGYVPAVDLKEQQDHYVVTLDTPGLDASEISVDLQDRTLSVSGRAEEEVEEERDGQWLRRERRVGRFQRAIRLPGPVDAEGMEAEYADGTVVVTIPKSVDTPAAKTITF